MSTTSAVARLHPNLTSSSSHRHFFKHRTFITFSRRKVSIIINCSTPNNTTPPPPPPSPSSSSSSPFSISSTAKIRSEVLTPFRSVRMFFYLAFIASASLGALIATTRLISAFTLPTSSVDNKLDIIQGLGIDLAAVSVFAFLYYRENNAKNAQISRLSREENLSKLKLRVNRSKVIPVSSLRGIARLVIVVGSVSFIKESFELCRPYANELLDRGVLVVAFPTDGDGNLPQFEFGENEDKKKRLWQLAPVNTWEWSRWLGEQKKLANVSPEAPVYISLRMDGRVRGSGVGYPPWNAFVAQLPPVKGLWSGLLDGMDGRV